MIYCDICMQVFKKPEEADTEKATSVHHVISRGRGGTNREENLIPLCTKCHHKIHHTEDTRLYRYLAIGVALEKWFEAEIKEER